MLPTYSFTNRIKWIQNLHKTNATISNVYMCVIPHESKQNFIQRRYLPTLYIKKNGEDDKLWPKCFLLELLDHPLGWSTYGWISLLFRTWLGSHRRAHGKFTTPVLIPCLIEKLWAKHENLFFRFLYQRRTNFFFLHLTQFLRSCMEKQSRKHGIVY